MSISDTWCTPQAIADLLPEVDLDPCSNDHSAIRSRRRVMLPDDGLAIPWGATTFLNPPYSNPLPWCKKAVASVVEDGADILLLLRLDPTTRAYATLIESRVQRVHPFRKRIAFDRPGATPMVANFPSVLVLLQRGAWSPFDETVFRLRAAGWLW